MKIIMELPHYSSTCGGIRDNIYIAEQFEPKMSLRFQNIIYGYPFVNTDFTVGYPNRTFPECDICITYSDNPYLDRLVSLPQIGRVYLLMLSYGMNLPVERKNIHNKKVTVLCSSKKIESAIKAEGVKVYRLGLGLNMSDMYIESGNRKKYVAILYHNMLSKGYRSAVAVCDSLYMNGFIDGVVSFGRAYDYDKFPKPIGLVKHYPDATRDQVRYVFNTCKCFIMPSTSEGLNLTPIESTLCGCPAIICDGAIDEVFFDYQNCFVSHRGDKSYMERHAVEVIDNFDKYSERFRRNMIEATTGMTWDKVITNLKQIIL